MISLASCYSKNNAQIPDDYELPTQNEFSEITESIVNPNEKMEVELNEMQLELLQACKYIGKTYSELEELFGELTYEEPLISGARGYRAQELTELSFLFSASYPASEGYCIGFEGTLNALFPSLNIVLTRKQFSEKLNAVSECLDDEDFDSYTIMAYIDFVPAFMRIKYKEEINNDVWEDMVAARIIISRLETPDEIFPDSWFSLTLRDEENMPPEEHMQNFD